MLVFLKEIKRGAFFRFWNNFKILLCLYFYIALADMPLQCFNYKYCLFINVILDSFKVNLTEFINV